ncbi:recombinase RecT [Achromobacter xylosoxidans]|uniref:recombinase RecT n=1 Tax=Alcaligenes xylosoxydans xylosoxydans TaxID=85698 RepID=UPI001EE9BD3C
MSEVQGAFRPLKHQSNATAAGRLAATTTPALAECNIPSLVGAIGQCAQMGLEPNTVLGHAYLVLFNTKRKDAGGNERWVKSVQVIVGYKGLIDLARRSGQIVSIAAHEVCENDTFDLVYGLDEKLEHRPAMGDRGAVTGFYAVAKLVGGGHAFEFMSLYQIDQIKAATQSKGAYGPWKDNFVEMGRKTVIRLLAKYLPLSIEFQKATALDEMASSGRDQHLDDNTLDGDFIFAQPEPGADQAEEGAGAPQQLAYDPAPCWRRSRAPQTSTPWTWSPTASATHPTSTTTRSRRPTTPDERRWIRPLNRSPWAAPHQMEATPGAVRPITQLSQNP